MYENNGLKKKIHFPKQNQVIGNFDVLDGNELDDLYKKRSVVRIVMYWSLRWLYWECG